jgi:hypothetical protein
MSKLDKIEEIVTRWNGGFMTSAYAMLEVSRIMKSKEVRAENVQLMVNGKRVEGIVSAVITYEEK